MKKIFGFSDDKYLTFLFLCVKYFLYLGKFKCKRPSFVGFKPHLNIIRESEYIIAKKKGKLSLHFKKWRFEV